MLWWYLSPARHFYSDWLWPYCVPWNHAPVGGQNMLKSCQCSLWMTLPGINRRENMNNCYFHCNFIVCFQYFSTHLLTRSMYLFSLKFQPTLNELKFPDHLLKSLHMTSTLLFYQIEPYKKGPFLVLPSSIARNSSAPKAKIIFQIHRGILEGCTNRARPSRPSLKNCQNGTF